MHGKRVSDQSLARSDELLTTRCLPVQAAQWVQVGESEDHNVRMFVDTASIIVTSNIVFGAPIRKASVRTDFARHSTRPLPDDPYWSHVVAEEAIYCAKKEDRIEGVSVSYEEKGSKPPRIETVLAWKGVIPDSVRQAMIAFICAWKPM
jgi:hypothetical protein